MFNKHTYKIIDTYIERATGYNMHVTRVVKACLAIHYW